MIRYAKHHEEWGSFVDIKINAPQVLKRQLEKIPRGLVSFSTVTDPYQPLEKKYGITRQLLLELCEHEFPISVLTKSDLVLRDKELFERYGRDHCEVGFSIATMDEKVRKHFEPKAPPVEKRIQALRELHSAGVRTWVFLAPILPVLTIETLYALLNEIRDSIDYLLVDKLNIKCGNWRRISEILRKTYPSLFPEWKVVLFSTERRRSYYSDICDRIHTYCNKHSVNVEFCSL